MGDIVVVGSINMDLVIKVNRIPSPGETIIGGDIATIPGGKGANQAVAASKMDCSVSMVARVGADAYGQGLLEQLGRNNVDTSRVITSQGVSSGTAVILVSREGQNSIVVSPGANGQVSNADIQDSLEMIKQAKLVLLQHEIPIEVVAYTAALAKQNGVKVILNPAPVKDIPENFLINVNILIPNQVEAEALSGIPVVDIASAKKAALKIQQMGPETVIITMGGQGASLLHREEFVYHPALQVDVVDTTAAGDAFIAGFASALLHQVPIQEALKFAIASGALAVTKFGAQTSLPDYKSVMDLYKELG